MIVTCPDCGARYQLAEAPPVGARLTCSACGQRWTQKGEPPKPNAPLPRSGAAFGAAVEAVPEHPPVPDPAPAPRVAPGAALSPDKARAARPIPSSVLDILHEEAARESALRAEHSPAPNTDAPEQTEEPPAPPATARPSFPAFPVSTAAPKTPAPEVERIAPKEEHTPVDAGAPKAQPATLEAHASDPATTETRQDAADALPPQRETVSERVEEAPPSTSEPTPATKIEAAPLRPETSQDRASGGVGSFLSGVATVAIPVLLLLLVHLLAEPIGTKVPELVPALEALDGAIDWVGQHLRNLLGEIGLRPETK